MYIFKKLIGLGSINGITALLNFISTFLIVKLLGLSILGQFALFKSYLAIGGLVFAIIPPNYSIFQLQDNKSFEPVFSNFFLLSSFVFAFCALFLNTLFYTNINILVIYLFGISLYWQGYFDIKFQSSGNIKKYFSMLLVIAVLKIVVLFIFYYLNQLYSLTDLLLVHIVGQGVVIGYYLLGERSLFKNFRINSSVIKDQIIYIRKNFSVFRSYYLNTILKRIRTNSLVLIFGNILTSEIIGIFTLFVKIDSFVLGLGRMIEAFVMNRNNLKEFKKHFHQTAFLSAVVFQLLYLVVGITYMKVIVDQLFLIEVFIQSLLIYPYIYFLLARADLLSRYKNMGLNIAELIYITIAIIGFIIGLFFGISSLYIIFVTYLLAKLGLQLFLIKTTKANSLAVQSVVDYSDNQVF